MSRCLKDRWGLCLALFTLATGAAADGDFGHKILGTVGLDAGSQQPEGIYAGDRYIQLNADRYILQNGQTAPVADLSVRAFANVFGVSATTRWSEEGPYYSASLAAPIAGLHLRSTAPSQEVDQVGLGDLYIEPLKLGWRLPRLDITTSFSLYAPTGQLNRKGLAQPQWSEQLSWGGTVFFDDARSVRLSALTSYNLYQRKEHIDITRGDSVQIQGGLGARVFSLFDIGVTGYGLWQVAKDQGSALPAVAYGQFERAAGLGPEIGIMIPDLRSKGTARYEWDLWSRSRLEGQVLVVSWSVLTLALGESPQ